jgi:flagellar protein FlaG
MTQILNAAGPIGEPNPSASVNDAAPGSTPAPAPQPQQPAASDTADLRLVIEDDQAAGCFVYKTVDWRTGEVVQQIPREQILKLREAPAYLAGDVIKTEA